MRKHLSISAAAFLVACLMTAPAMSQISLDLGGINADVDLGLGQNDSLLDANVDLGLGNAVNANANANVGGGSLVDADAQATIGGNRGIGVDVDFGVGGGNLLDANVGIGIGGTGGPGGPGGPGLPGGPGAPGGPGSNGSGINPALLSACAGQDATPILTLMSRADYSGTALRRWGGATGIQVVPVSYCRELLDQLRRMAANDPALRNAIMGDPLIAAALSRNNRSAGDVLAVNLEGRMLNVYVR